MTPILPSVTCPLLEQDRSIQDAIDIWRHGVAAVDPEAAIVDYCAPLLPGLEAEFRAAARILVVGAGKAGGRMALGLERLLANHLEKIVGLVNVPEGTDKRPERIVLHPARPAGSNHPTAEGVVGADKMLELFQSAGPNDLAFCLISGGGSALLPAPVVGVSLEDKQRVTRTLHACGATINEMNTVRKHLSRIKGGRLAEAFRGQRLLSLIISDVIGDPIDVIASGPTTADPSTFADALAVLMRYGIDKPQSVLEYLQQGRDGQQPETPKSLPSNISNLIVASNPVALEAAKRFALSQHYHVLDLGPYIEGETRHVASVIAGIVRNLRDRAQPLQRPACILVGGETTVTLTEQSGKGGRNQEFVLAMCEQLGLDGMKGVVILSAGTDGEDGPTDAAGAVATATLLSTAQKQNRSLAQALHQHDAYPFFAATGGLLKSGLTGTNVMDLRVVLVL